MRDRSTSSVPAAVDAQRVPAGAATASPDDVLPTVRFEVAMVSKLNLASYQNAVPALQRLAVVNATASAIEDLALTVTSEPAFLRARTWRLDALAPGATFVVPDTDVRLDGALLSRLTEAEAATLRFELRCLRQPDTVIATHENVVELLARNQWGGIGQSPEMAAAFVQPNDPAVDRLLKAAAQALEAGGKSGSIDGYTRGARGAWELASGIWTAVLQRRLNYAFPPAGFEHTGQKVRGPAQVLDAGLATCLDLALLFAACLEQAHLNALLVFTRGHAFVGLWLRDEQFPLAVVDDVSAVRNRLKLQQLLFFETTLAAQGQPVTFGSAIAQANRQLAPEADDSFEMVVDIKRARLLRVKPLASASAQTLGEPESPPAATGMLTVVEDAPDVADDAVPDVPTASLSPFDRLARWQRRLLDLSLRNALLNFRPGKKSLLLDVAAPALEDALAGGRTLKLLPSPDLMQGADPRSRNCMKRANSKTCDVPMPRMR